METYIKPLADTMQALDFTSSVPRVPATGPLESPILDLSCKKDLSSCESRWNLPASGEKQPQGHQLPDSESQEVLPKSPFEGRTFMVTPPSESDSPKKIKYEAIYNCSNVTNSMLGQAGGFPVLPMTVPFPVPGVISTMFKQNSSAPIPMVGSSVTSMTSSTTNDSELLATSPEVGTKTPRPFKAYPKDPLSLSVGPTELMFDPSSNEAYSEFRKRMLESVRQSNEGTAIKMRRITKSASLSLPTSTVEEKDAAYRERRRKNNEAAKRSRDARRAKEDEIAIRAAFLEQENMKLKYELVALRNETAKLKCMVYST